MKRLVLALSFAAALAPSLAHAEGQYNPYGNSSGGDVYVHSYTRSDGTSVEPHYRSPQDGDRSNNWSTKGNVNPYTGQAGTKNPW
jgi:hypothetical protein